MRTLATSFAAPSYPQEIPGALDLFLIRAGAASDPRWICRWKLPVDAVLVLLVSSARLKIQWKFIFQIMELRLMQELPRPQICGSQSGDLTLWHVPSCKCCSPSSLHKLFSFLKLKPSKMDAFSLHDLATKLRQILTDGPAVVLLVNSATLKVQWKVMLQTVELRLMQEVT